MVTYFVDQTKKELEPIPHKERSAHCFASILEADQREREAVEKRNRRKLQEARERDYQLEIAMQTMDRMEKIVDKLVEAIDRNTKAHSTPILNMVIPIYNGDKKESLKNLTDMFKTVENVLYGDGSIKVPEDNEDIKIERSNCVKFVTI